MHDEVLFENKDESDATTHVLFIITTICAAVGAIISGIMVK